MHKNMPTLRGTGVFKKEKAPHPMSYLQDVSAGKEKKKVKTKVLRHPGQKREARKGADGLHREPRSHADQQVHSATEEEDSRDEGGPPRGTGLHVWVKVPCPAGLRLRKQPTVTHSATARWPDPSAVSDPLDLKKLS